MSRSTFIGAAAVLAAACSGSEGCPNFTLDCGGVCVDVLSSPTDCGACGAACGPGQVCEAGSCVLECQEGRTLCTGVCRDLSSDQYNCGVCGTACSTGFVCLDGSCVADCPEGYTVCDGVCRDLQNNPSHCGACGSACAAGEVCHLGTCTFACPDPYVDCSGSCADLGTDHMNCGTCGTECGEGEVCTGGTCTASCYEGLNMCSGVCVDLMRDPDNCGACARSCATGEFCYDGDCTAACPGGFTDCAGTCRDLENDRLNCGTCGTGCDVGNLCDAGACVPTCDLPLVECGGTCTDTSYDRENCGACGTSCTWGEACVASVCETLTLGGPKNILFVSDSLSDTNIPTALTADGHTVTTVTGDFATGNATLRGSLSSYQLVYWSATGSGYGDVHSSTVITALEAYVSAGGCVFVTGYDSIASPTDTTLIGFVGGTGSVDVPGACGPVTSTTNNLNFGRVDIRGVTPTGGSGDRDALTGLTGVTAVAYTSGSTTQAQWTLRTLGSGQIAYVSNGDGSPSTHASWTTTTSGGAGAYNAALRNFAYNCI